MAPAWTVENFGPFIHETIEFFGSERCMFASNVPPDAISRSHVDVHHGSYHWMSRYPDSEQRQLFHDTASAFYRL